MMKSADVSTSFVSPGVVVRRGLHFLPVCVCVCVCVCVYVYVYVYVRDVRKMLKVFEWTILRSSVMNMITQIIYLGRAEVGDW